LQFNAGLGRPGRERYAARYRQILDGIDPGDGVFALHEIQFCGEPRGFISPAVEAVPGVFSTWRLDLDRVKAYSTRKLIRTLFIAGTPCDGRGDQRIILTDR
jgi:hypothetical protein